MLTESTTRSYVLIRHPSIGRFVLPDSLGGFREPSLVRKFLPNAPFRDAIKCAHTVIGGQFYVVDRYHSRYYAATFRTPTDYLGDLWPSIRIFR